MKSFRKIVIPEIFFKKIAEKKNKLYSRIWFYWLANFVDEINDIDFLEKQIMAFPKISEIREIYEFGIQLLRQDFEIIEKENTILVEAIIEYLNSKVGTTFSAKSSKNRELINARLKEGFTISDFKIVIDKKTQQWKGTKDEIYLRPLTLFNKSKFENYLNGISKANNSQFSKITSTIADAKVLIGFYDK